MDWMFRIGLYKGSAVKSPGDLIDIRMNSDGQISSHYLASINEEHDMADWLINDCQGPWTIRMRFPVVSAYLSFARAGDAVIFRLKS
jgi:hypothetical protein